MYIVEGGSGSAWEPIVMFRDRAAAVEAARFHASYGLDTIRVRDDTLVPAAGPASQVVWSSADFRRLAEHAERSDDHAVMHALPAEYWPDVHLEHRPAPAGDPAVLENLEAFVSAVRDDLSGRK